jgi:electron transport complex protein RnfE
LCPSLAVTTALKNGIAMGLAATFVLVCSNAVISLIRNRIPKEIRIPCFIVVIASFVTIVELFIKAYFPPELGEALGIFIALIVVNCIIMYRAETFASKNPLLHSVVDGAGIGLGYTMALILKNLGCSRSFKIAMNSAELILTRYRMKKSFCALRSCTNAKAKNI